MSVSRILIIIGFFFVGAGVFVWASQRWPFLPRLGRLPGDIRIEGKSGGFYFPWVTCLVLSGLLTLILRIIQGMKK